MGSGSRVPLHGLGVMGRLPFFAAKWIRWEMVFWHGGGRLARCEKPPRSFVHVFFSAKGLPMNKRNWMKCIALAAWSVLVAPLLGVSKEHPNIVYINIDDMGWTDISCMGSEYYETPNIDRLAQTGMTFTDAYAPAANCAPSRACCMSGRYGPAHGIYTVGDSDRGKASQRKLIPIKNETVLPDHVVTLPEALQAAGYATCHAGKWHLGPDPCTQGIDVNIGGREWGGPGGNGGYWNPGKFPNLTGEKGKDFLTDRLTDEVLKFLQSHKDQPFFLYFSPYAIHTPIMSKPEIREKYKEKKGSPGHNDPNYAALIETLDTNVGRILDTLDELALRERTFVLFTSDNGGMYRFTKQWPLRAGKGSYFEGGIRVPLLVRWPGKIKPGSRCDTPVTGVDYYPTFLDVANVPRPEEKVLDGLSLVPLLTSQGELPPRPLFWHFPIYLQNGNPETHDTFFRTRPGSVVRHGDWKLHEYFEDGRLELYNLKEDIGETRNVAERMPEKAKELHEMLLKWRDKSGAPVPATRNPRYEG